jgi:hypothetical protein
MPRLDPSLAVESRASTFLPARAPSMLLRDCHRKLTAARTSQRRVNGQKACREAPVDAPCRKTLLYRTQTHATQAPPPFGTNAITHGKYKPITQMSIDRAIVRRYIAHR